MQILNIAENKKEYADRPEHPVKRLPALQYLGSSFPCNFLKFKRMIIAQTAEKINRRFCRSDAAGVRSVSNFSLSFGIPATGKHGIISTGFCRFTAWGLRFRTPAPDRGQLLAAQGRKKAAFQYSSDTRQKSKKSSLERGRLLHVLLPAP